jgi:cob(I)alamin adenosyltransferase
MDRMEETTGELSHFILPGGHPANSAAHIARTVCRRLERALVRLHTHEPVRTELTIFVNRLSDWLFMLARLIAHTTGVGDRKRCQPPFS